MDLLSSNTNENVFIAKKSDRFFKAIPFGPSLRQLVEKKPSFPGVKPIEARWASQAAALELEDLRTQLEEKSCKLRHKSLWLAAIRSENKVMRKNIKLLMQENASLQKNYE